ncbi:MAG: hypothetical protein KKD39_04675 [Candidatus Altiarchaeota archaeon]|nr:hypothetical protein [Candidatus Altiarchaeota archaeon]
MKSTATLITDSMDAASVASSLNTDNICLEGLSVKTYADQGSVVSVVSSDSLTTLLSTVDDLLRCQMASESLL